MVPPTEHQSRLLCDMLEAMDTFRMGGMSFGQMVGSLEGALDAGEFRDRDFIRTWYELWSPLEVIHAVRRYEMSTRERSTDAVAPDEVEADLAALEAYITHALGGDGRCRENSVGPW